MNIIWDKLIDGLFIFVGVYFAFHFDQYQQDLQLKKELDFNLTQIIRDLPENPPPERIARFELKQSKNKEGKCDLPLNMDFKSSSLGEKYLDIIKQRGLVKFVPDQKLIRFLTYYYDNLVPKYERASQKYFEFWQEIIVKNYTLKEGTCLTEKELTDLTSKLKPFYMNTIVADGFAGSVGNHIYKMMLEMGYKSPKKETQYFSYRFEEVDPEILEKEKSEEEKKKGSNTEAPSKD